MCDVPKTLSVFWEGGGEDGQAALMSGSAQSVTSSGLLTSSVGGALVAWSVSVQDRGLLLPCGCGVTIHSIFLKATSKLLLKDRTLTMVADLA